MRIIVRRSPTAMGTLFLAAAAAVVVVVVGVASAEQPNIVLIIADDLGFNDVSFRGSNQIPTPNIDALAFSGMILDHHYVLPTCTPSRTAILTGQYPIRTGMQGFPLMAGEPRGLPLKFKTLPERLASLGYRTNLVGKWHQGCHHAAYTPNRRGFHHHMGYWNGYMSYFSHAVHMDSAHGLEEGRIGFDLHWDQDPAYHLRGQYATHLFTRRSEDIIREHNETAGPLFLQIAHLAAHAGLNGTVLEVPDKEDNDRRHNYIPEGIRRDLAGVIRELDVSVGRVVKALQDRGILNNTIIVFMADNGGETQGIHSNRASNWPLRGQKWTVYEGGVRGAAVVWSPKLTRPGSIFQGLVHATDWLPTFYHAAGGNVSDLGELDGISLWDSLVNNTESPRAEVLVQVDKAASIIQRDEQADWKLVKGQLYPHLSGYLGDSGRGLEVPPYNVTAVLDSDTASALGRFTPRLTANGVLRLRAEAGMSDESCRTASREAFNVTCSPYCLFNLVLDPCEAQDVRDQHRDLGDRLLQRLASWESKTVKQINQPVDEAADPRRHNMTWVSWLDGPGTSASTPTSLPAALAALLSTLFALIPFI